jgi:hypothetical protein
MDEFTTQGMTDAQMKDINRCRIYLQVFYTWDIAELAVNNIEDWAKKGNGKATERASVNGRYNKGHLPGHGRISKSPSRALHQKTATSTAL